MSPLIENLVYGAGSIRFGAVGTYDPVRLRQEWEAVATRHRQVLSPAFVTKTARQRMYGMLGMFVSYVAAISATVLLAEVSEPLACVVATMPALAMIGMCYWKSKLS